MFTCPFVQPAVSTHCYDRLQGWVSKGKLLYTMCCAYGVIRLLGATSLFCCCQTSFFFPSNLFLRQGFSLLQMPSTLTVSALQIALHQPPMLKMFIKILKINFYWWPKCYCLPPFLPFVALIVLHRSVHLTYLDYKQELAIFCSYSWYQQYNTPKDNSTQNQTSCIVSSLGSGVILCKIPSFF